MKFQDFVKNEFFPTMKRLEEMCSNFPWEDKDIYLSWLAQSYEYALRSTRILALTAAKMPEGHTLLSNRFVAHAAEEKNHDRLLRHDAKSLGADITQVPVLPEAEAFHKSLYFWLYEGKPVSMLGWVLCLEGFAVQCGKQIYPRIVKAHGAQASTFIKVHGEEDEDHIKKALEVCEQLSETETAEVIKSFRLYCKLYENIYSSIVSSKEKGFARAA